MSLKEVKAKIRAVSKIHQVTKAMEAVSAVKMRRSQQVAIEARPFALHAVGILRRLVKHGGANDHPLVKHRPHERNICIIVVTSDRGLAGALNSLVFRKTHALIKEKGWTKEQIGIYAIGRKCNEHFSRRGFTIIDNKERWGEGITPEHPSGLAHRVIDLYASEHYDRVMLVYSNFESTFVQEPVARRLLPISFIALEEVIAGIVPERGKYSELRLEAERQVTAKYFFEPTRAAVLDELLPYLVGVVLYNAIVEANASEHSARMVAMKSASDRARDLTRGLTLKFNKARQSSITAEIGEITSGIEAMR